MRAQKKTLSTGQPGPRVCKVKADDLLSTDRLDIMARLDYAESKITRAYNPWATRLYRSFLLAADPTGKFGEDELKFSIHDYESQYVSLIDSLMSQGFDAEISRVTVSRASLINGAHRVAASLALGIPVETESSNAPKPTHLGHRGLLASGLSQDIVEYMVWRYVQNKQSSRVLVFSNISRQVFEKSMSKLRSVLVNQELYYSELALSEIAKRRLVQLCYGHQDGWTDSLAEKLVSERYVGREQKNFFVIFDAESPGQEQEIKQILRRHLSKSVGLDRQIYGSHSHLETLRLVEPLLNRNSRQFLNFSPLGSENRILENVYACGFSSNLKENQQWCIDGSATLELFGIRKARDVDYVSQNLLTAVSGADLHNSEYLAFPTSFEEIIFDPRKHLRIQGLKFISLSALVEQKVTRGETKDNNDISQVAHFLFSGASYSSTEPASQSQAAWRARIWVGRKLEAFLNVLPRVFEPRVRKTIKALGSLFWRE